MDHAEEQAMELEALESILGDEKLRGELPSLPSHMLSPLRPPCAPHPSHIGLVHDIAI